MVIPMKIVIAGLGAGGFAAAISIKKYNRKAEILFIDPKAYDLMHPCGLPYALEGIIPGEDLTHDQGLDKMKIGKISGRIVSIDTEQNLAVTDSGEQVHYDKLLISTGAQPVIPPIPGIGRALTLESVEALQKIQASLQKEKQAVVIGGGAIGLEAAWALKVKGMKVKVLEMAPAVMGRSLDPDFSDLIKQYLEEEGIPLLTSTGAKSITEEGVHCGEETFAADLIINAVGFAADLSAAESAGLKMGKRGILTDKTMRTSHADIYAVGDCIETFSPLCEGTFPVRLATTAYRQGVIAGAQIAGKSGGCWEYTGSYMSFVSTVGKLEVAAAGLTSEMAKEAGYTPLVSKVKGTVQPEWMAHASEINLKLIFDKESRKLIGCQAIGTEGAAQRVNLAAMAMRTGLKAEDLLDLEMAYCPSVSKTWDIFNTAVENALRRLKL